MAKKQPLSLSLLGTRLFLNRGCVVGVTGRHQKSRRRYAGSQVLRAKQRCFINKGVTREAVKCKTRGPEV